jgi:GNAT superfamily N-acetyltransferase
MLLPDDGAGPAPDVAPVETEAILALRERYRDEMRCQIVHDSHHARGFLDSYLLRVHGEVVGYGCVGGYQEMPRVTVREFFLVPDARPDAVPLFRHFLTASGGSRIEVQTNDRLLTRLFYQFVDGFTREKILFSDATTTTLSVGGATFRRSTEADRRRAFTHSVVPVGDWVVELEGRIAGTGGVLLHYNPPFGDIYMEVHEPYRRRGIGSLLVQELKRVCYEMGRVPAARCNVSNDASRATLQKAGMVPCALIISGEITGQAR